MRRTWTAASLRRLGAIVAVAALAACGDDATPTTPATPTTTTTTTTLPAGTTILQGSELLQARQVFVLDVVVPRSGRLEVTVDYNSASSDILLWLTDRQCSFVMFDRDDCNYLVKSEQGPKPRTMTVPSVAAGTYTLFVHNNNQETNETLTYRIILTP